MLVCSLHFRTRGCSVCAKWLATSTRHPHATLFFPFLGRKIKSPASGPRIRDEGHAEVCQRHCGEQRATTPIHSSSTHRGGLLRSARNAIRYKPPPPRGGGGGVHLCRNRPAHRVGDSVGFRPNVCGGILFEHRRQDVLENNPLDPSQKGVCPLRSFRPALGLSALLPAILPPERPSLAAAGGDFNTFVQNISRMRKPPEFHKT